MRKTLMSLVAAFGFATLAAPAFAEEKPADKPAETAPAKDTKKETKSTKKSTKKVKTEKKAEEKPAEKKTEGRRPRRHKNVKTVQPAAETKTEAPAATTN